MQDNINIIPNNKKHGYWEMYWNNNKQWYKAFYVNGSVYGYSELLTNKLYHAK